MLHFPCNILGAESVESEDEEDGKEEDMEENEDVYLGIIWVFANISGMITFLPDGSIHSINNNFSLMLFGYSAEELMGKVGTTFTLKVRSFCKLIHFSPLYIFAIMSAKCHQETALTPYSYLWQ